MIWALAVAVVVIAGFTLHPIVALFVAIAAGIAACVIHDIVRKIPPQ